MRCELGAGGFKVEVFGVEGRVWFARAFRGKDAGIGFLLGSQGFHCTVEGHSSYSMRVPPLIVLLTSNVCCGTTYMYSLYHPTVERSFVIDATQRNVSEEKKKGN